VSVFQRADERPLVPTLRGKVHNLFGFSITSEHRESIGYTPPKEAFPNGQTWVDSAVRPT
jgi:hypothetical protein